MSFISDNFISYDDEFLVKQEKLSVHEDSLEGSSTSEAMTPYSMPQTLQNLLNANDHFLLPEPSLYSGMNICEKKHQPFKIIKPVREDLMKNNYETFEVKIENEEKLVNRSKRIQKREKAKQRLRIKQECASPNLSGVNSKYIPEGFDNPDLDDKTRRKMVQMIRNRISAQSSRDRKKAYMMQLEDVKNRLADENNQLITDNEGLMRQLKKLERTQRKLQNENQELKKNMELICSKCGQSRCAQVNKEVEADCSDFANLLSKLTGTDMTKLSEGNKTYKRTMTFATMISIMMVMNLVQQGGQMMQDNSKAGVSSDFERKTLQKAAMMMDGGFNELGLMEQIMPFIRKFEENHRLSKQQGSMETETDTSEMQPGMIKIEEIGTKGLGNLAFGMRKKPMTKIEDETLFLSDENADKKKFVLGEEQDFGFLQNFFKTNNLQTMEEECDLFGTFGKLLQGDNKKENNFFNSMKRIFTNNSFGYN